MLAECAHFTYLCTGNSYIQGGNIPHADDGLNSLATNRRHGGFLMIVYDPDLRHKFQQVFYGMSETGEPVTGDNFNMRALGFLHHSRVTGQKPVIFLGLMREKHRSVFLFKRLPLVLKH